jgi:hypothetical protein
MGWPNHPLGQNFAQRSGSSHPSIYLFIYFLKIYIFNVFFFLMFLISLIFYCLILFLIGHKICINLLRVLSWTSVNFCTKVRWMYHLCL